MKPSNLKARDRVAPWLVNAALGLLAVGVLPSATRAAEAPETPPAAPVFVSPAAKTAWKFSFGGQAAPGSLAVSPTTTYSLETGYGFEPGSIVTAGGGCITSTGAFLFSAAVPEGNYRVIVTLGDTAGTSNTTVKAEARRLMLENLSTANGQTATHTFTVNVHTPIIAGDRKVLVNGRELGPPVRPHWDEKLTLEFNGTRPCVASVEIARVEDVTTIFLAGDSTVTDQNREPYAAWGQMLPRFFKPTVAVANYGESGLTLDSFRAQRRLEKILSVLKRGDYVFIQFGHNDQKDRRPGAGAATTYKANLEDYIARVREKDGIPILVTPMERRRWQGGQPQPTLASYAEAVRQVGTDKNVPVIDLNAMSLRFYAALGANRSKKAFAYAAVGEFPGLTEAVRDDTHFSNYGAYELARSVVESLKTQVPALVPMLVDGIAPFDPATPDPLDTFAVPHSVYQRGERPAGS